MRVLVTGGAGYVGSTVVPLLLEAGHDVTAFDVLRYGGESLLPVWAHPRFTFVRGDIRDRAAVEEALRGVESVIHLAAIVGDPVCAREPSETREVNEEGSLLLVAACRGAGVRRFIFASTCSNYGRMVDPLAYADESTELRPVSLYAETKVAVERSLLEGQCVEGWSPTVLRFATVFGVSPRMRFDLTVNEFTLEVLVRRRLVVFGEQFWRPYVHVRDAARAICMVLNAPESVVKGEVFNVGSTDQNYRKTELVELVKRWAPDAMVEYVHREDDPRDYRVSFDKIRRALDFSVSCTVEAGIAEIARAILCGVVGDVDSSRYRN